MRGKLSVRITALRSVHLTPPGAARVLPLWGACALLCAIGWPGLAVAQSGFVNWENHPLHSLEITPDGSRLLLTNTPDNRLEILDLTGDFPSPAGAIPVGLDPVSVRAWDDHTAWVVNHISDSVSVVDLDEMQVMATLPTADEPYDIIFAGSPRRAFVSCSQSNKVLVFDPLDLEAAPIEIPLAGEDPRALAVSPDGATVYVGIFESGNRSTILGGGSEVADVISFPPNVVNDPLGPWGGVNPPPNDGLVITPPPNPANPAPLRVGLIVKQNAPGQWMDDNGGDWTSLVSGANANRSARPVGWTLADHDVAIIDADTLAVSYQTGLMNIVMALGVHPVSGAITVVGTDAINEVRFEPIVGGVFVRVMFAAFGPGAGPASLVDLNPHLDYSTATVNQATRDLSLGDPRGIVWTADGQRGFISGMGSNNVIVVNAAGERIGQTSTISVGEGPIGLAVDDGRGRLYVHDRFEGAVSVVDLASESEIRRVPLFDPTPPEIRLGRPQLYDTHKTSGLGQASCASCHVDARMDRLAWDLGDPAGEMKNSSAQNRGAGIPGLNPQTTTPPFRPWHPMKGPMTTQTLQDIIGHEPHHWRGDRDGIEEFNGAFVSLLGDDMQLTSEEMQAFEDFLATIIYPPNPYRNPDNTLPQDLPLPGHHTTGRFAPAGQPLPNGDAVAGLSLYTSVTRRLDRGAFTCATCHTLPTGMGTDTTLVGANFQPIEPGPNGEHHLMVVSVDGSTNRTIKVPQLRNLYEKVGMDLTQTVNLAGFGLLHDGSVDSIARFVGEEAFDVTSDQEIADLVAFLLSFSGGDLPLGGANFLTPPSPLGQDTHAAVGMQLTIDDIASATPDELDRIGLMTALAESGKVGLVARAAGRGFVWTAPGQFQSDRASETRSQADLLLEATPLAPLTLTVVPAGTQVRIGIDRDADSYFDRDELDACSDPANAASVPGSGPTGDLDDDGAVGISDLAILLSHYGTLSGAGPEDGDLNGDGDVDLADLAELLGQYGTVCAP